MVGGGMEMEGGGIPCSREAEEVEDSSNSGSEGKCSTTGCAGCSGIGAMARYFMLLYVWEII